MPGTKFTPVVINIYLTIIHELFFSSLKKQV